MSTTPQTSLFPALLPTNDHIRQWSSHVSDLSVISYSPYALIQNTTDVTAPSLRHTAFVAPNHFTSQERLAASGWARTGQISTQDRELLLDRLTHVPDNLLPTMVQHKIMMGTKKLRERFPVVLLGNPERCEIIVQTDPLTIMWDGNEQPIGQFWIGIVTTPTNKWNTYCRQVRPIPGWYSADTNGYTSSHPHLPRMRNADPPLWGTLCTGDAAPDIENWLSRGDLERAFLKIVEQLESYNAVGAHVLIEQFLSPKCPNCFNLLENSDQKCLICLKKCSTCGKYHSVAMFLACDGCGVRSTYCPLCELHPRCRLCGRYSCQSCYSGSRECLWCKPEDLDELGVIHAISSETIDSNNSSLSVESPNVLVSQPEGAGSERDGSSAERMPF